MLGAVINLAIIEFIALSLPDSGHKDYLQASALQPYFPWCRF